MANLKNADMDLIHFPLIMQKLCNALPVHRMNVVGRFFDLMANTTQLTIERAPDADPKRPVSTFDRSPFLVNAISNMIPTKDENGAYFCISFQDVFDNVFEHTPFFSVDRLKFSWVFFGVFIKSPVQFYIDGKAFDSTIFHNFCFSSGARSSPTASSGSSQRSSHSSSLPPRSKLQTSRRSLSGTSTTGASSRT